MSSPVADPPSLEQLETLCIELAGGAAQFVSSARAGGLSVTTKSTATDLVTDVDRATEQWLRTELERLRPGDAVLGEEDGARAGHTAVRWIVDPIDGTVNFVLGLPYYAVSVAAEVDAVVVAGAVANPVSGELFHARRGGGAYLGGQALDGLGGQALDGLGDQALDGLGGQALDGPRTVALDQAVVATGFAYDPQMRQRQMAVAAPLLPLIGDLRRLGSAALDLCHVAAGRLDACYEAGLNPWDYAAGALIAAEAGCVVGGLRGAPPSARMCVAAGAALAPDLFALLESLGADGISR